MRFWLLWVMLLLVSYTGFSQNIPEEWKKYTREMYFYAVTHDFLKEVEVRHVSEYEEGLYERMAAQHHDVLEEIRTTGQLSSETEAKLKLALENYTRDFLNSKK